jgi:hypothetical protein
MGGGDLGGLRSQMLLSLPSARLVAGARIDIGAGMSPRGAWGRPEWSCVLRGSVRFYLNKMQFGYFWSGSERPSKKSTEGRTAIALSEARVATEGATFRLPYIVTRYGHGIRRGSQYPWLFLDDPAHGTDARLKATILRKLLAQLPANVSFNFALSPNLSETDLVVQIYKSAGFKILHSETLTYTPPAEHGDLIDTFSGKSIKGTLRRARRDMEIVEMSPSDFVHFHEMNIESVGKTSHRDFDADRFLLEEGLSQKKARILAARRKPTAENPGPFPMDAALACVWDSSNGFYKLWRLTYRVGRSDGASEPHPDASKFLILAAMEDAAAKKLVLDTDGYTPGLEKLYATFGPGVFKLTVSLECLRDVPWALVIRDYPSLIRALRWMRSFWSENFATRKKDFANAQKRFIPD